jgi:hypothetical protein
MNAKRNLAPSLMLVGLLLAATLIIPTATLGAVPSSNPNSLSAEEKWGRMETFDEVPTGTTQGSNGLTFYPSYDTDIVFLDGCLWVMFRGNESREIMQYEPLVPLKGWNISFEAFTPREGSSYYGAGKEPGRFSLISNIQSLNGSVLAGIDLRVGSREQEGVYFLSEQSPLWSRVGSDILPAYSRDTSKEAYMPDRYTVAYAYDGHELNVTVVHSLVGMVFRTSLDVEQWAVSPVLRISDASEVTPLMTDIANYGNNGGWMLDNFAARPSGSPYPRVAPLLETVDVEDAIWLSIVDENGEVIPEANVSLGSSRSSLITSTGRYQAMLPRPVDWAAPTSYLIDLPDITIEGRIKVTTTFQEEGLSVTQWWNGWDWATVFGLDDCIGPDSALQHYSAFDHPTTAYVMFLAGSSRDVLDTDSEIGMHNPHDYMTWMKRSWSESEASAEENQQLFRDLYEYASRWDSPSNGGLGDTYLSLANPGNSATYQMMFAQYLAGTRIEGMGSQPGNGAPGNTTWIGSYGSYGGWNTDYNVSWSPLTMMDLMDANRLWSTDNPDQSYEQLLQRFSQVADRSGLLRVYGHPEFRIFGDDYRNVTALLDYLDDIKPDGSPENWKATDGEVASYIYGSRTTDVKLNRAESTNGLLVYDVERKDPRTSGYWNVPITLRLNIEGAKVVEVKVVEGDRTYSSLGNGNDVLPYLNKARVMDCGYDIRGDLYVSHFWNSSSKLIVRLESPIILNEAPRVGLIGEEYNFTFKASIPDSGENSWNLNALEAPWISMSSSSASECTIQGTPTMVGRYPVSLMVQDANTKSYLNWTINVGEKPDITDPVTSLGSMGNMSKWNREGVTISFASEDEWSGVWWTAYRLDDGPWLRYEVPMLISELGWHNMQFHSVDNSGNVEDVTTVEFGIDDLPPEVQVMTENGTLFPKGDANIIQLAWDNTSSLASMEVLVDEQVVYQGPYTQTVYMPGLEAGDREVRVVVQDAAGNEGFDSVSIQVGSLPARPGTNGMVFLGGSLVMLLCIILVVQVGMSKKGRK